MTACDKAIYWVLVVSNTLSGLIYGLFTAFWYKQIRVLGKPPEQWLTNAKIAFGFWVAFSSIASGLLLISGVVKIRSFFKDRNAIESIETGILLSHAIAFGLYLFVTIWWAGAIAVFDFSPDSSSAHTFLNFTILLLVIV